MRASSNRLSAPPSGRLEESTDVPPVTPNTATQTLVRSARRRPRTTVPFSLVAAVLLHGLVILGLYYFVAEPVLPSKRFRDASGPTASFRSPDVAPPVEDEVPEELLPMEFLPVNDVVADAVTDDPLILETLPDVPMPESDVEPVPQILSPPIPTKRRTTHRKTAPVRAKTRATRTKLKMINRPNIEKFYPWEARVQGLEGTTVVRITVAASGVVSDATVATSSGSRLLDEAALRVAYLYRFGSSHGGTANLPVRFRLY